jgi:putative ABC transport system substrate-binding protein
MLRGIENAAKQLGLKIRAFEARTREDIERAFAAMGRELPDAVVLLPHPLFGNHRALVTGLALKHRLPMSVTTSESVEAGGLFAYAPDYTEQFRRAATYVDKILKGAKPAELPVEQPTKFDLLINAKTATALGLQLPQSLLLRADRVFQ